MKRQGLSAEAQEWSRSARMRGPSGRASADGISDVVIRYGRSSGDGFDCVSDVHDIDGEDIDGDDVDGEDFDVGDSGSRQDEHIPSDFAFDEPSASEPQSPAAPRALEKEHAAELAETGSKRARGPRPDPMFSIENSRSARYILQ